MRVTEHATFNCSNRDTRPPCTNNCNMTEGTELIIPSQPHLVTQIPILMPIDNGCMQTIFVIARIEVAIRKECGEIQNAASPLRVGSEGDHTVPNKKDMLRIGNERPRIRG